MSTDKKTHTFDWHKENQDNTFLAWALVTFAGFTTLGEEAYDRLSEATDKFQNIELGITVNGIAVDAEAFMKRLDQAVDSAVESEARKMIANMPRLNELFESVYDFEAAFKEQIIKLATDAGLEMDQDSFR